MIAKYLAFLRRSKLSLEYALPIVQVSRPESSCCNNGPKSLLQGLVAGVPLGRRRIFPTARRDPEFPVLSCE
jgi:hypothetical protein